jgi:hypothetical protein
MPSSNTLTFTPNPYASQIGTGAGSGQFNANPGTQAGFGAYGGVPGPVGLPSPAADLGAQYPNLSKSNNQISNNVLSELSGELSPEALANIDRAGAAFGLSSGMPLSGASKTRQLQTLGLTTEELQRQGLGDYLSATGGISKTQTLDPSLQTQIADRNATMASAPNPAAAAQTAQSIFQQELDQIRGPQGGMPRGPAMLGPSQAGAGAPPRSTLNPDDAFMNSPWSPANGPGMGPGYNMQPTSPFSPVSPAGAPPPVFQPVTGNLYGGGAQDPSAYDLGQGEDAWLNSVASDPSNIYEGTPTATGDSNVDTSSLDESF